MEEWRTTGAMPFLIESYIYQDKIDQGLIRMNDESYYWRFDEVTTEKIRNHIAAQAKDPQAHGDLWITVKDGNLKLITTQGAIFYDCSQCFFKTRKRKQ